MDSKAPVVVLVAIIILGALLWGIWAIQMAGGVDPERAKTLAEEAERECVLEGYDPDRCPELVGRHHRGCIDKVVAESEKPSLEDSIYLKCMKSRFAESTGAPDAGGRDAGGREGTGDATADGDGSTRRDADSEDAR